MVRNTETTVVITDELLKEVERIKNLEGNLSSEDEKRLIEIYKLSGDRHLGADVMYFKHYESIRKICKQFAFRHNRKQYENDYIQSAYIYMIEALDTYKFSCGARFNTHLAMILKKCLNDSFYDENNTSKYYQQEYYKIGRFITDFEMNHGRTPTDEEIMKALKYTESRYNTILMEAKSFIPACFEEIRESTENEVFDKDNHMKEDSLYLDTALKVESPDEIVISSELSEIIVSIIDDLGPDRADLLLRYAGIGYSKPQSIAKICQETGLSKNHVKKNLVLITDYAIKRLKDYR